MLAHMKDALAPVLEEAANDLAIIIAAHEVVNRRKIGDTYATRHHLEEMVKVLSGGVEAIS